MIQKHISKIFEVNIYKQFINLLDFNSQEEVLGIYSIEKEHVKFNKSIDVNEGEKLG